MKAVILSHTSDENARAASAALNALSGVVAVDVHGAQTVSHCGDRLDASTVMQAASDAGGAASLVSQRGENAMDALKKQ